MEVFNSKNVASVIFTLGTSIVLVVSFWGFSHWSVHAETIEKLEKQFNHWQGVDVKNYTFVATDACMLAGRNKIKVVAGVPELIDGKKIITIDERFKLAKEAIQTAYKLQIEYHPLYGFPQNIEVDWNEQLTDDECSYSITAFEPL